VKRNQVWRRDYVDARRAHLAQEISADVAADRSQAIATLKARIRRSAVEPSVEGQLDCVLATLELLTIEGIESHVDARELSRLNATAKRIFERQAVNPRSSRLAHLYGELEARTAALAAKHSERWTSAWSRGIAEQEAGVRVDGELHDIVDLELQLGHGKEIVARLLELELSAVAKSDLRALRLTQVEALILSGDHARAEHVLASLRAELGDDVDAKWQAAILESIRAQDPAPQVMLTRLRGEERRPERLLDLFLWAHASKSKAWMSVVTRASSLRRTDKDALDPAALSCAEAIERCHDGGGSVQARLNALGRALGEADRVVHPLRRMLVWAAAARWLIRVKRRPLATLPSLQYRALSLALTGGVEPDVLNLALELIETEAPDAPMVETGDSPPVRKRERAVKMSKLAAEVLKERGIAFISEIARRKNPGARVLALATAEIVTRYMDELKGPFMKLGQLIGYWGFDLPEDVRDALCSLQDSSTGMSFDRVKAAIAAELGDDAESVFQEIDALPLGTGSIGQVHRAVTRDGREVALKVQYPDVAELVKNDMIMLRAIAPAARLLLPGWDVLAILAELDLHMKEECDYAREAEHQSFFRSALAKRADVVVPEVITPLSRRRVLTSELIRGERFEDFRRRASPEERTRAAETIFSVWIHTALVMRSLNSDVQPGNLLFLDRAVALVDFGNCVHWKDGEGRGLLEVLLAVHTKDVERFRNAFTDLGFASDGGFDFVWGFERLSTGILGALTEDRTVRIRFEHVQHELEHFFASHASARVVIMPPRYLLGMRAYWGMLSTIARLDVEVNLHRAMRRTLDELAVSLRP
jgi:predicted unusual protein kinase regulating ubiquinone biosynthesis (AarF/ABC1/UbiB family)